QAIEALQRDEEARADERHLIHLGKAVAIGPGAQIDRARVETLAAARRRIDHPEIARTVARHVRLARRPTAGAGREHDDVVRVRGGAGAALEPRLELRSE